MKGGRSLPQQLYPRASRCYTMPPVTTTHMYTAVYNANSRQKVSPVPAKIAYP